MSASIRKFTIVAGLLCLLIGGFMMWRAMNPPLTDDQIVLRNLTAIQEAAENRQTKTVAFYLAKDFTWSSMSRQEFIRTMSAAFFQARDVQVTVSGVELKRTGPDTAETSGNYTVSMRRSRGETLDNAHGRFKLFWRKIEGEWKVYKAEGGTNIGS